MRASKRLPSGFHKPRRQISASTTARFQETAQSGDQHGTVATRQLPTGRIFACYLVSLLSLAALDAQAQSPQHLVTVEAGDLPIILTAPHGGRGSIVGVEERGGKGIARFRNTSDVFTDQLTEKLADALEAKLGQRPYVIIARFHRKYIDANRRASQAYESEAARPVYDTYHNAISAARRDIIDRWRRGILLDVHGQGSRPQVIFRGTQNGKTTTQLEKQFGQKAVRGSRSFFGRLAEQKFQVNPAANSTDAEHDAYDGGYTVVTYGGDENIAFDAIQLELGRQLRSPDVNADTADRLANAIVAFANDFLPAIESDSDDRESRLPVFLDDFADGNRDGWFAISNDSSALSVKQKSGQLKRLPDLNFAPSDPAGLQSFVTHFPPVTLRKPGDRVSVTFDARHNSSGFVDRGFRFGLFDSGGTQFDQDGNLDLSPTSLDDKGCFAMVDLGSSTTNTSAVIRETNNGKDKRLWNGRTLAADDNDGEFDSLMFTRNQNFTYTFTMTRNSEGGVNVSLSNRISGDEDALIGTSSLPTPLSLDTIYFGTAGSAGEFAIDNVVVNAGRHVRESSTLQRTVVGVYVDKGTGGSLRAVLRTLADFENVSVRKLTADNIRAGELNDVDVLIQPGGSGSRQGNQLRADGRESIRRYVRDGGGYIGICGGAYLASAHYKWSLNILDARAVDTEHWARGHGMVQIGITDTGKSLLRTTEKQLAIQYWQGPLLAPANRSDIDDYDVIATFDTEIAENGAPKGVMTGTTAIAKGKFGKGGVICFSPHPELTDGLEQLIEHAIDDVKQIKRK